VALLNVETGEARMLLANGGSPAWSSTGHLLFSRGETLLAVPFDLDRLSPAGGQVAIADGLRARKNRCAEQPQSEAPNPMIGMEQSGIPLRMPAPAA